MSVPLPMTPARRAILAFGIPIALAVIVVGAAGWASGAVTIFARQVSYRVAVSVPVKGGHVSVTVDNADVTVGSSTGEQIQVRGTLRESLVRPTFSWRSTAAGLALHSQCRVPAGVCSIQYTIAAPARFPIAVTGSSGNMHASDLRGMVTLSDGSGDLGASNLAGDIRLDDGSGNITASGLAGGLRFQDGSGNVVVNGLAGTDVVGASGSGDITLTFTKIPDRVQITDGSGNITLVLPRGGTAYQVNASTQSGARVVTVPVSSSSRHVITLTNQSGDVTVTR